MAVVGIDLGTTNSLIGIIKKGRPLLFKGPDGSTLIPSVVHFDSRLKPTVGSEAKRLKATDPLNAVYSAKRFLGKGLSDVSRWIKLLPFDFSKSTDSLIYFNIRNHLYNPIEISSLILKELKSVAEQNLGEAVSQAVVTVPAYFNDSQRQATKLAAEAAGLEVLRIVNEPTAACLAYGLDKKTSGLVAVYDLGGGTFDISILRVTNGIFEVLATSGDTELGGDDFDQAIAASLRQEMVGRNKGDPFSDRASKALFLAACERLKIHLTDAISAPFKFSMAESPPFTRVVSQSELEEWILPVLERTQGPCRACLTDAKITSQEISDVIMVGGSTRTPRVAQFVKSIFGREPISSINPDEVVALGATVQANIMSGQLGHMLLLDVIPLSLSLETMGGVVSRIVHRNSTIPVSATQTFSTYVDGQVSVDIHVVQGERELANDNRSLARFQLKGLPPLPAGVPKIEVEFTVDANGILSVRAIELRTMTSASITVNPTFGLDDAGVTQMLTEAFENAEGDFSARFLIEARTEAEALLRDVKKSLSRANGLLNTDEKKQIELAVVELEKSLPASDRTLIREKMDALSTVTTPLAERLLNQAVRSALKDQKIT